MPGRAVTVGAGCSVQDLEPNGVGVGHGNGESPAATPRSSRAAKTSGSTSPSSSRPHARWAATRSPSPSGPQFLIDTTNAGLTLLSTDSTHNDATASARWRCVSGRQHLHRNGRRWHIYPPMERQPASVSHRVGGVSVPGASNRQPSQRRTLIAGKGHACILTSPSTGHACSSTLSGKGVNDRNAERATLGAPYGHIRRVNLVGMNDPK
jgi:hypothetical protein